MNASKAWQKDIKRQCVKNEKRMSLIKIKLKGKKEKNKTLCITFFWFFSSLCFLNYCWPSIGFKIRFRLSEKGKSFALRTAHNSLACTLWWEGVSVYYRNHWNVWFDVIVYAVSNKAFPWNRKSCNTNYVNGFIVPAVKKDGRNALYSSLSNNHHTKMCILDHFRIAAAIWTSLNPNFRTYRLANLIS